MILVGTHLIPFDKTLGYGMKGSSDGGALSRSIGRHKRWLRDKLKKKAREGMRK